MTVTNGLAQRPTGWHHLLNVKGVAISVNTEPSLYLWKAVTECASSPEEVCTRILHERMSWDWDVNTCEALQELSPNTDIFYYANHPRVPIPPRNYCLLRHWCTINDRGDIAIVCKSVDHQVESWGSHGRER